MKNIPDDFAPQRRPGSAPPAGPGGFAPEVRLDYGSLLARFQRNWYWFALAIALALTLAFLHLRYTTPLYEARTSVLIQEQSSGQGGLSKEAIATELGFESSYVIDNEVYMLRSNYLMERVVRNLGLDVTLTHQGAVRNTEIYEPEFMSVQPVDTAAAAILKPELMQYGAVMVRFDGEDRFSIIRGEGDTTSMRYTQPFPIGSRNFVLSLTPGMMPPSSSIYELRVMDPTRVAREYAAALNVTQVERSGVVNLQLADPVPEKAKDILNAVILAYERQIVEQQSQTGAQTLAFLDDRLTVVTEELDAVETTLARFRQSANLNVDLQTQGADYLARANVADQQLAEQSVRKDLIESIRTTLTEGDGYQALPLASEVLPPTLIELITRYNQMVFERDQKLEGVTLQHPTMASYDEQLDIQKRTIMRSIGVLLAETNQRIGDLESRLRPIESNLRRLPANEQRMLEIMRDQSIQNELYIFLLTRREEAALTVAAQVPNTRTIDRASVTPYPISPNRTMVYLLAIGVGLIVPASTLFLRELLGKTVSTEEEIMNYLPYPVVGRIVKSGDRDTIVVSNNKRSGVAEGFRLLRTNLSFLLPDSTPSVVMITSSVSGEGKSFISSNLSAALALTSKRVVVVGLDMRKPRLAEMVLDQEGASKRPGLSNFLIGKATLEEVLQPTTHERLSIITSGPIPPNPAELLLEDRIGQLIQELKEHYDIIILDAPPVGIVTDALLMKDYVNVTLFIARVGISPKKSMSYINELVDGGKLPRVNLVINGIDPKASYGYGYGYYE